MIRIVDYDPSYAGAVAEMWNRSAEGWNGAPVGRTAEVVLSEHENSVNLRVFLALDGEDVVGYCSFSKYAHDEGALYIPLLNVRPDYHGRKVGKALVLRCVRLTAEMGWPRLDLFTWPGNTKAVPLYKKCGFFWEKRDDATHLMNFIPTVLATEAVSDYFDAADWYDDSTRIIAVRPDGVRENGFDYLAYSWEKDGRELRMEFERTGRGLRLVDTGDYRVSAVLDRHELVCGRDYKVRYEIVNKSGRPLTVSIKGLDDKNIRFAMDESVSVADRAVLEGEFHVGEIEQEQNVRRTHPAVAAEILINGKRALFRTGIEPKHPAGLDFIIPGDICYPGKQSVCYLDLENNFQEDTVFAFDLPEIPGVIWERSSMSIRVKGGGRLSVALPYTLTEYGASFAEMTVMARPAGGEELGFKRCVGLSFRGDTAALANRVEHHRNIWEIINGAYAATLDLNSNMLRLQKTAGDAYVMVWFPPKIGLPFSIEFSRKHPDEVGCYRDGNAMVMRAVYSSDDFSGLRVTTVVRLYANGICRRHLELGNTADLETPGEISLSDTFHHNLFRGVIPYDGRFVEIGETVENDVSLWESGRLTENWLFSYGDRITRGITWEEEDRLRFDSWAMYFQHDFGRLQAGAVVRTRPVTVAMDLFRDWRDFRSFALRDNCLYTPPVVDDLDLEVNGGNPFVGGEYDVRMRDYKAGQKKGRISLASAAGAFAPQDKAAGEGETSFRARSPEDGTADVISASVDDGTCEFRRTAAVFPVSGDGIRTWIAEENGQRIFQADNGFIRIKAAPSFAPSIFSLATESGEWLATSFPTPKALSWWNPWVGGFEPSLEGMPVHALLKEKTTAAFVACHDSLGNPWQGIVLSLDVREHEKYRGLGLDLYYLLLPGARMMCHLVGVRQSTGSYLNFVPFGRMCFMRPGGALESGWAAWKNRSQGMVKMKAGREERRLPVNAPMMFGAEGREEKLLLCADTNKSRLFAFVNIRIIAAEIETRLNAADGGIRLTPPVFFVPTRDYLGTEEVKKLFGIGFDPHSLRPDQHNRP